jgi:hypothetical protein
MKRLRTHGLIKKIGKTYKYYITGLGKQVIALGLKLKNLYVIPELSAGAAAESLAGFGKDLMIGTNRQLGPIVPQPVMTDGRFPAQFIREDSNSAAFARSRFMAWQASTTVRYVRYMTVQRERYRLAR